MLTSAAKTVLLTGGRAPATLDLARAFHAAGHRVVVAESLPEHLCRYSRAVSRCYDVPAPNTDFDGFISGLAAIARTERADLLIPTCEEVFHVARGRATIEAHCPVFAPSWKRLGRLHSKWRFITDLAARGVTVPDTHRVTSAGELAALLAERPNGERLVLKPEFSRFGEDVVFHTVGAALPAFTVSTERPWVVQARVTGRSLCSYSVARDGVLTAHTCYAPDFTAGPGASVHFTPLRHAGVKAWVQALVRAEGLTGQVAFDFIESDNATLYPLECNPRATSGVHLLATGGGLAAAFLGEAPGLCEPAADTRAMLGLAMLVYALPELRGPERLLAWAEAFGRARDVIFSADDPAPFFHQFVVFGALWARGRIAGVSALAASTRDIEWNGAAS